MYKMMLIAGLICAAAAVLCLILTVVLFFALRVPAARRFARGEVDAKMVDGIRRARAMRPVQRREVMAPAVPKPSAPVTPAAVVRVGAKKINEDFIIEKSMIFVSTDEVM